MSWQNFPMIICPHCNKTVQIDDYYEIEAGDCFDCPNCEKIIYVWAIDTTLSGDIYKESPPEW